MEVKPRCSGDPRKSQIAGMWNICRDLWALSGASPRESHVGYSQQGHRKKLPEPFKLTSHCPDGPGARYRADVCPAGFQSPLLQCFSVSLLLLLQWDCLPGPLYFRIIESVFGSYRGSPLRVCFDSQMRLSWTSKTVEKCCNC